MALSLARRLLTFLPGRSAYRVAFLVADFVYLLHRPSRAAVAENLRNVMGEHATGRAFRHAQKAVFRNTACNYIDLMRIPELRPGDLRRFTSICGLRHLIDAVDQERGVVVVSAHLGAFEMGGQLLASLGLKATVPVEPLEPPAFLDQVMALRNSQGLKCVPAGPGTLHVLIECLRRGEVVMLPCDRIIGGQGVKMPFFGKETSMPALAVTLARRTGAAIVPAFCLREAKRYRAHFEPAIQLESRRNGVEADLGKLIAVLEDYIRRYPEQWLVLSRVWDDRRQGGRRIRRRAADRHRGNAPVPRQPELPLARSRVR